MAADVDFALALHEMDGVGRVTMGRLLEHFGTYEAVRSYPREGVLTRIRGVSRAEALVARLFDEDAMRPLLDRAAERREALAEKRVTLLTPASDAWPAGLGDLPRAERPALLYLFGRPEMLAAPAVALFARPPLESGAFEYSQRVVRRLADAGVAPATGASHGFDVVVHKLAADRPRPQPSLLVAPCGLARIAPSLRPTVAAVARAGGLCLSPFPMPHGPFDHDDRLRALVLAALTRAAVFVRPEAETPEAAALAWALEANRPVFDVGTPPDQLPPPVPALADDLDALIDALPTA